MLWDFQHQYSNQKWLSRSIWCWRLYKSPHIHRTLTRVGWIRTSARNLLMGYQTWNYYMLPPLWLKLTTRKAGAILRIIVRCFLSIALPQSLQLCVVLARVPHGTLSDHEDRELGHLLPHILSGQSETGPCFCCILNLALTSWYRIKQSCAHGTLTMLAMQMICYMTT